MTKEKSFKQHTALLFMKDMDRMLTSKMVFDILVEYVPNITKRNVDHSIFTLRQGGYVTCQTRHKKNMPAWYKPHESLLSYNPNLSIAEKLELYNEKILAAKKIEKGKQVVYANKYNQLIGEFMQIPEQKGEYIPPSEVHCAKASNKSGRVWAGIADYSGFSD
jgi:hypothetical protein